jgi:hypothetical protein
LDRSWTEKISLLFLALFLFAGIAPAQDKPEAPKPKQQFNRKVFVAGVSLLAAAKTADAITTRRNLDQGGWENNPVFGRHPSPVKQAGINLAFFAGESAIFYFTEHNRHTWIRWTGRALLAHSVMEHSYLAACNAGLNPHAPGAHNCGALVPWF